MNFLRATKYLRKLLYPALVARSVQSRLRSRIHSFREHFWARYDSALLNLEEKVLFVDLGANLGQGYGWFKQYFNGPNVSFELFEPNPFCFEELCKLPDVVSREVNVYNVAVGKTSGKVRFYGLSLSEGGKFSQGGSIVETHNSSFYRVSKSEAIEVDVLKFADYISDKSKIYNKIIVKMDIEGAEVDLLESMINDGTINNIDVLYVEFHSQYKVLEQSKITREREKLIISKLAALNKPKLRIWH